MTQPVRKGDASGNPADAETQRLLKRHLEGDDQAFARLVHRYKRPIYGFLVRSGVPRDVRDDLFQEVFSRVHAAATSYRFEHSFRAWLFTIATNVVRSWYRRQKTRRVVVPAPEPTAPEPGPDALTHVEVKEMTRWLEEAVRKLPARQREVVLLTCVEQLSHEEAAMALGMPVNTVKTHLHRARRTLAVQRARACARLEREVSR